jgi:hypothetical protein
LSGDESSGFTSEICNRIGSNYSMKFASTRKNVEQILQVTFLLDNLPKDLAEFF